VIMDHVLYRRFEQIEGRRVMLQLVIHFKLRRQVFELVHGGVTVGHMGRKRTEVQVQRSAYWPGWT